MPCCLYAIIVVRRELARAQRRSRRTLATLDFLRIVAVSSAVMGAAGSALQNVGKGAERRESISEIFIRGGHGDPGVAIAMEMHFASP